ncbi:hypothetical protein BC828DRAFT_407562, partial [Blastocladiella britannica]
TWVLVPEAGEFPYPLHEFAENKPGYKGVVAPLLSYLHSRGPTAPSTGTGTAGATEPASAGETEAPSQTAPSYLQQGLMVQRTWTTEATLLAAEPMQLQPPAPRPPLETSVYMPVHTAALFTNLEFVEWHAMHFPVLTSSQTLHDSSNVMHAFASQNANLEGLRCVWRALHRAGRASVAKKMLQTFNRANNQPLHMALYQLREKGFTAERHAVVAWLMAQMVSARFVAADDVPQVLSDFDARYDADARAQDAAMEVQALVPMNARF